MGPPFKYTVCPRESPSDKFIPVDSRSWTSSLFEPELECLDYKWFVDEIKSVSFCRKGICCGHMEKCFILVWHVVAALVFHWMILVVMASQVLGVKAESEAAEDEICWVYPKELAQRFLSREQL